MLLLMDDDDQDNDPESNPDKEEYLSDEVLNENDFITDPSIKRSSRR